MLGAVSEGPRRTRWLEIASAAWTTAEAIYLVGLRATTDATLVSLTQDEFLSAVAGHTDSASAAEAVVTSRVGPRVDPASPA